jgi:hypothetical protein
MPVGTGMAGERVRSQNTCYAAPYSFAFETQLRCAYRSLKSMAAEN